MLPHWATPMQACYNLEFTPNPYYNHPPAAGSYLNHQSEADSYLNHQYAAGSYMDHQYMWQNQENNTLLQCNALHDPAKLSNKSILAEDAAIAFSEMVRRNIVKSNPDFNQLFTRNSQPEADDIRKDRKRQSNRESAKRTRLRKKHEREDRTKIDTLNEEIAVLTKQLRKVILRHVWSSLMKTIPLRKS